MENKTAPGPERGNHGGTTQRAAGLALDDTVIGLLHAHLSSVAEQTVDAITVEVPHYTNALSGSMGRNIREAVQLALGGFLRLVASPRGTDAGTPLAPALEGAYALGRGEARSGRSMDALLAAYRVGARVSWRELSTVAVSADLDSRTLARFAELVFAYIDELSAASVAGHTDELANTGRVRRRHLERLGQSLLAGEPLARLTALAGRAEWEPPQTLAAVLLPGAHARGVVGRLDPRTLQPESLPGLEGDEAEVTVLLVPDVTPRSRPVLLRTLAGRQAWVGPTRPWTDVRSSYERVLRVRSLGLHPPDDGVLDTEEHLAELVLAADRAAIADLRADTLAPLRGLRPGTADRLEETLLAWLLHQGRRDDVAAALHVHPQTVRYRMGQLRELYGERLTDPGTVLSLVLALAAPAPATTVRGTPDDAANGPLDG